MDLASLQSQLASTESGLPPVDKWDPPFCGDLDIVIKRDGTWFYQGTPIGRKALVKLFAGVLKKENDDYFLVTPVEKVGIRVEDAPFLVTEWDTQDGVIVVTTNVGDSCILGEDHPVELRIDSASNTEVPYINIRRNLWARCHQNVFYQWAEIGQEKQDTDTHYLSLQSGDYEFSLGTL